MDIFTEVTPATLALISFMVIGGVKLVDQLFDRDFRGVAKILVSILIGSVIGYFVDGLSIFVGAAAGLAASGLVTTVGYTKKTTPVATIKEPELG